VAGLRLCADQAELSAESPRIGYPAGVLNSGVRASIPLSRGLDGVAVAESAPQISWEKRPFSPVKKIASGFAGGLRLFHWGSSSPESGHRVYAAGTVSRRALIPASGQLTPLAELVESGCLKGNSKHVPERNSPPSCDAEGDDGCGYLIQGVVDGKGTVVSDSNATESYDRSVDGPSNLNEAASVILFATSDVRLDALCTQGVVGRLAVVSAICEDNIRMTPRPQLMTDARIKTRNRVIAIFAPSLLRTHYYVDWTSSFTSATL